MNSRASRPAPMVVAFGGNALVRGSEHATQRLQIDRADELAASLLPLLAHRPVVLVHGNGPQVGDALIRVEEAVTKVPPLSLDLCVASTAGSIGVLLERALRNAATGSGLDLEVVTLLTLVEVEEPDPQQATKPVGAHFTRYRADSLRQRLGWKMIETAVGSWRRVVPSPVPRKIFNTELVRSLLQPGRVVIAGGGGGVPVVLRDGRLHGVEAVVDKDDVAGELAVAVQADELLILTDVECVFLDFCSPRQRPLARISADEAQVHLEAGQFPEGSMGPKIRAAIKFVRRTGGQALITSVPEASRARDGNAGTRITLAPGGKP